MTSKRPRRSRAAVMSFPSSGRLAAVAALLGTCGALILLTVSSGAQASTRRSVPSSARPMKGSRTSQLFRPRGRRP